MIRVESGADRHPLRAVPALVLGLALALACGAEESRTPVSDRPPNLVLIIGDDHGWPYFGFMGDEIVQTPNLDALAAEGVVFPFGYATASTCRPTLRSLLTGLHPLQWRERRLALRAGGRSPAELDRIRDFRTLPGLLQQRGYASFQGGKYWEGSYAGGGFTHGMKSAPKLQAKGVHAAMQDRAGGDSLALGRTTMQPLWDFLDENRERPFFVWFAPKLPHTPHDASAELLALYADPALSEGARRYYANITRFDRVVGELVERLDALGLRDDTLIVYLSDNGWEQGPTQENRVGNLGGPRGKSSMYELGFRTPVVVSWPARIEGGRTRGDLVSVVDVFTTLLDFAGLRAPADRTGVSLRPALRGEAAPPRTRLVGSMSSLRPPEAVEAARADPAADLVRAERAYFLRDASWHYVLYSQHARYGDRPAHTLHRVDGDPHEAHDVADLHPELTQRFRDEIRRWTADVTRRTRVGTLAEPRHPENPAGSAGASAEIE